MLSEKYMFYRLNYHTKLTRFHDRAMPARGAEPRAIRPGYVQENIVTLNCDAPFGTPIGMPDMPQNREKPPRRAETVIMLP